MIADLAVPDGNRLAIHERRVKARVDRQSGNSYQLEAAPYVLPHLRCPQAVPLAGGTIAELRDHVSGLLAREPGCTHLNNVLRAHSSVPILAQGLPE